MLDDLIQLLLTEVALVFVHSLYHNPECVNPIAHLPHDFAEILLILLAEHANQVNLMLEELPKIEIDVLDDSHIYVLVIFDKFGVKVAEQLDVPLDNDDPRVSRITAQIVALNVR